MKFTVIEIVQILAVVGGAMAAITALLINIRDRRISHYNEARHKAELDEIRASLESRIYMLMDRLVSGDRKWEEMNHLIVSGQEALLKSSQEAPLKSLNARETQQVPRLDFLKRAGADVDNLRVDRKLVFVLVPFHPSFEPLYAAVSETCSRIGLRCLRGDEENVATGNILGHILQMIVQARLVIAIVDGRNPNVFYELGISHAIGKPVLMIAKSAEDVPFDIKSNRILFYTDQENLRNKLLSELAKAFASE